MLSWRLLRTIIVLPGTALVFVPAIIVYATRGTAAAAVPAAPGQPLAWLGLAAAICGLPLMIWTVRMFHTIGKGTPAPWDPPTRLIVRGPYRHVRNPMITGVLFMLLAEAAFLRAWPLVAWAGAFFALNAIYFLFSEEPGLARRFGDNYRAYKAGVPRWIPRLRPWSLPE